MTYHIFIAEYHDKCKVSLCCVCIYTKQIVNLTKSMFFTDAFTATSSGCLLNYIMTKKNEHNILLFAGIYNV